MPDYDAHDFDDDDQWEDCDDEEDEEEGVEIPLHEGGGQLQTNDSSRGNHLEPSSTEEGSDTLCSIWRWRRRASRTGAVPVVPGGEGCHSPRAGGRPAAPAGT